MLLSGRWYIRILMEFSLLGRRRRRRCRGLRKCFLIKSCRRRVCVCLRRRRRRTRPYYDETGSENEVNNAEDEVEEFEGTGETVFTTINCFMTLLHFLFFLTSVIALSFSLCIYISPYLFINIYGLRITYEIAKRPLQPSYASVPR